MNISVDLSMYPLKESFESDIIEFIKSLRDSGLRVEENGLSTQVFGPYDRVMALMTDRIQAALSKQDDCVFVMKIVTGDRKDHVANY